MVVVLMELPQNFTQMKNALVKQLNMAVAMMAIPRLKETTLKVVKMYHLKEKYVVCKGMLVLAGTLPRFTFSICNMEVVLNSGMVAVKEI